MNVTGQIFSCALLLFAGCYDAQIAGLQAQVDTLTKQVKTLTETDEHSLHVLGCTMEEAKFLQFIKTKCDEGNACNTEDVNLAISDAFHDQRFISNVSALRHRIVYPDQTNPTPSLSPIDQGLLKELLRLPALPTRRFVIVANYSIPRGADAQTAKEEGRARGNAVRDYLLYLLYLIHPSSPPPPAATQAIQVVPYSFTRQKSESLIKADRRSVQPDLARSVWVFYVLC